MVSHLIDDTDVGRRGLLRAGLITFGAAGIAAAGLPAAAQVAPSDATDPEDAKDPEAPKGMRKNAQIDARFPVSYRRSVPAACRVVAAHFDAIATRSYTALARTMQFPFAIVERLDAIVVKTPSELADATAPYSLNFTPVGRMSGTNARAGYSFLSPGDYDMLISLEVLNFDPCHVNMAMTFDRYNKEGFRTIRCEGVYCVTNNEGHWGIQLMSTIWTPFELIGLEYPDTKEAAIRLRVNHIASYIDDTDINDRPRPHRGLSVGISGGGIGNLFESQGGGDPMVQFRVKGVKSRLQANDRRGPKAGALDPAERRDEKTPHVEKWVSIRDEYARLGQNFAQGGIAPGSRIIHHTSDKAHRYSGAARYAPSGEELSISMEVSVIVMGSGGDWTQNGNFRYVTVHNRTDNLPD